MIATVTELQTLVVTLARRCTSPEALAKAASALVSGTPLNLPRAKAPVVRQPKAKATRARIGGAMLINEDLLQALREEAARTSIAEVGRRIGMPRTQMGAYLKPGARASARIQERLRQALPAEVQGLADLERIGLQ
jgi:hypothetical protein